MDCAHYSHLAELFDFPAAGLEPRGRALAALLRNGYPGAAAAVDRFLDGLPPATLDLQELHTRTFDVQSLTTLDLGYVLFGDDYKRGALLSHLNQEHGRAANDCRGELADHLPNVLRLLPKIEDEELRSELAEHLLIPALVLMLREFEDGRVAQKTANYRKHYKTLIDQAPRADSLLYRHALQAALEVLTQDFASEQTVTRLADWAGRPQTIDFLAMVSNELEIEDSAGDST
jgi:nitrate reductase assembly molybdenum cofactor insertion protein NarJ